MYSITADVVFDGYAFQPRGYSLQVNDAGEIMSCNQPEGYTARHLEGLLLPGLINVHCHTELSYLRNQIPTGTGLIRFVQEVIRLRPQFSIAEKLQSIQAALVEMESNGIVAVGDICNGLDSLPAKMESSLQFHSFVECLGLQADKAEDSIHRAKELLHAFQAHHGASLVPHAPYSVSAALMNNLDDYYSENDNTICSIHNQESEAENTLFQSGTGGWVGFIEGFTQKPYTGVVTQRTSLQSYLPQLPNCHHLILVHNTFIQPEDFRYLQTVDKQLFLCLCPNANLYIEGCLPPVKTVVESGIPLVLGTDSLASNHQLCIMREVQTLMQAFPDIPVMCWLQAATANGAKALQREDTLGSFSPGLKPGFTQIINWKRFLTGELPDMLPMTVTGLERSS
jgi:cytosine/adenosine deaminase-related metal-dependent hydrolase